jgi:hypothetical protein
MKPAIEYWLEGNLKLAPARWEVIATYLNEADARAEEAAFIKWMESGAHPGWLGFRVVKVETTRTVLQNDPSSPARNLARHLRIPRGPVPSRGVGLANGLLAVLALLTLVWLAYRAF